MKAVWNNVVLAESDKTIEIEGNQYFPPDSVHHEYLKESTHTTECPWKGTAHYYHVAVNGKENENAAWYYPNPEEGSTEKVGADFRNYVSFWQGVEVAQ